MNALISQRNSVQERCSCWTEEDFQVGPFKVCSRSFLPSEVLQMLLSLHVVSAIHDAIIKINTILSYVILLPAPPTNALLLFLLHYYSSCVTTVVIEFFCKQSTQCARAENAVLMRWSVCWCDECV